MADPTPLQGEMLRHLRQAVTLGYSMHAPGSSSVVREAFPDVFATSTEIEPIDTSDGLEIDAYPMVSRDDSGCFVQTWTWVPKVSNDEPDKINAEPKTATAMIPIATTVPPDPENMNEARAQWADEALSVFRVRTGTDVEDSLGDLLCDLMHWADRNGCDFEATVRRAALCYQEETGVVS